MQEELLEMQTVDAPRKIRFRNTQGRVIRATRDFKPGMRVIYVPRHADGDKHHRDCERGVVSSIGERYVFVIYDQIPKATSPNDLVVGW